MFLTWSLAESFCDYLKTPIMPKEVKIKNQTSFSKCVSLTDSGNANLITPHC
jgi:hypothetical protein